MNLNREILKGRAESILKFDIDKAEDVVGIFDSEMNYILANPAACILLSKKKEELEGKNLLHVFPSLTASVSHRYLLSALSGKTIFDATSEGSITREGAKFLTNYYPLSERSAVYAVIAVTKKVYFPH